MSGQRVSRRQLWEIDTRLSKRERSIMELVGRFDLLSGEHLRALCFSGIPNQVTSARRARATLRKLTDLGLLDRLSRRIGGERAGSDGYLYALGVQGYRLVLAWAGNDGRGRVSTELGARSVRHRLAVADTYVRFVEAQRTTPDSLEVLGFETEPDCWRSYDGYRGNQRRLKPDAYLRLGVGDAEHRFFCELDLGTVSRKTREDQAAAYRAYWRSEGELRELPRVLWITPNDLVLAVARQAVGDSKRFVFTTLDKVVEAASASPSKERP